MKVLIVCSGNVENFNFEIHQAFIYEQIESLKQYFNIEYDTFFINGKGIVGYLNSVPLLKKKIKKYSPDIVHAHFGLSGLLACFQRKIPLVITFHGSDAHVISVKFLSKIAARLSKFNIFVENKIRNKIKGHGNNSVIPCGINLDDFFPMDKSVAREMAGLKSDKKYILFSSRFDNEVKNYSLAKSSLEKINEQIELIELKNKTRNNVNLLLNACDFALLTSTSEGSPQFIKEAMACNCPIVATDVGDINEVIGKTEGCYLTSFDVDDVADKIKLAIKYGKRTNGRATIKHYDNKLIAQKISKIYKNVVEGKDDYGY